MNPSATSWCPTSTTPTNAKLSANTPPFAPTPTTTAAAPQHANSFPRGGGGHPVHLGGSRPAPFTSANPPHHHGSNQTAPQHFTGGGGNNNNMNNVAPTPNNNPGYGGGGGVSRGGYNGGYNSGGGGVRHSNNFGGGNYHNTNNNGNYNNNNSNYSNNNNNNGGGGFNNNNGNPSMINQYGGGGYSNNFGPSQNQHQMNQHNNNNNNGNNPRFNGSSSSSAPMHQQQHHMQPQQQQQHNNNMGNMGGPSSSSSSQQQQQQQLATAVDSNNVAPVILFFDTDAVERNILSTHICNLFNYSHLVMNDTCEGETAVEHYKRFRAAIVDIKKVTGADDSSNSNNGTRSPPPQTPNTANAAAHKRGWFIEVRLSYHCAEMYYFFDELRNAGLFPTHIIHVEHAVLADVKNSDTYDHDERARHPLAFDTCSNFFSEIDPNFLNITDRFERDAEFQGPAWDSLVQHIRTPMPQLMKIPEHNPFVPIFKYIPLLPNVKSLTALTDRIVNLFSTTELYAKPSYVFDYGNISRNAFHLPNFYSTIDMNGTDVILAKIDEAYYVFLPKYIALCRLEPEQVPVKLREMRSGVPPAASSGAAAGTEPKLASPTSAASEVTSNNNNASETNNNGENPADGIAWVINATICLDNDQQTNGGNENNNGAADGKNKGMCTIYAKDIIFANGAIVANQSFNNRHVLLKSLVPEQPEDEESVIVVRQRYYPALETKKIFEKLDRAAALSTSSRTNNNIAINTAGNGIWFINPGKAQLRSHSDWNFKYSLFDGGFDARLWDATENVDTDDWTFNVCIQMCIRDGDEDTVREQPIGKINIPNDIVNAHSLNDGQIVRLLIREEQPKEAAPAPQPKGKGGKNAAKAVVAPSQPAEPKWVFSYLSRQDWTFFPTNEDPRQKRLPRESLLEALAALE